jgi:hypothetical protein
MHDSLDRRAMRLERVEREIRVQIECKKRGDRAGDDQGDDELLIQGELRLPRDAACPSAAAAIR